MKNICVFIALIILTVGMSLKPLPIERAEDFSEIKFYVEGNVGSNYGARVLRSGNDTILVCEDAAIAEKIYKNVERIKCTVIVTNESVLNILSKFDVRINAVERLSGLTCYYGFTAAVAENGIELFDSLNNIQISDNNGVRCIGFPIILTDF